MLWFGLRHTMCAGFALIRIDHTADSDYGAGLVGLRTVSIRDEDLVTRNAYELLRACVSMLRRATHLVGN